MGLRDSKLFKRIVSAFTSAKGEEYSAELPDAVDFEAKALYLIEKFGGPKVQAMMGAVHFGRAEHSEFFAAASSNENGGNVISPISSGTQAALDNKFCTAFISLTNDQKSDANGVFMKALMAEMAADGELSLQNDEFIHS